MHIYSKKVMRLLSVWQGREFTWTLMWKKSLLTCFKNYLGILCSHTGRVDRGQRAFCSCFTLTLYVRTSLEDKSMFFTQFLSYLRNKHTNLACISRKQVILWHSTNNLSAKKPTKSTFLVKWTAKYVFS